MPSRDCGFRMRRRSQSELFDQDTLSRRLFQLGLRGVARVESHENQSVMVSVTPKQVLRVHKAFAYAPDSVLDAIVKFVNPGTRRGVRAAMQQRILTFPVHAFVPPIRPRPRRRPRVRLEDRPLIRELEGLHNRLSEEHFDGTLSRIPFRVSRRMRRRLGDLSLDPKTDKPIEISISHRHIKVDGWDEVEQTLLHEMVHQWQAETGRPVDHGAEFRRKARAVGIVPRAARRVRRSRGRSSRGTC